jgi:siroheme decarboxylase
VIEVQATIDQIDRNLLNKLQTEFALTATPYRDLADGLGLSMDVVINRVKQLKENGIIRQIGAIFDSRSLGYSSTLVAMKIAPEQLDNAAELVSSHSGVSHNYARNHAYNLWFTLTVPPGVSLEDEVSALAKETGADTVRLLPTVKLFKIGVAFDMMDSEPNALVSYAATTNAPPVQALSEQDIAAIRALQEDLPIEERPFKPLAERAGMTEDELLQKAREMLRSGVMRRFGAALRHRRAGFMANAMGVWVVPECRIEDAGRIMAGFSAVSHCYQRPNYPDWPYSLFTMIHGRSVEDCETVAKSISEATGITEYGLLYSAKEYKKTRVKYYATDTE